jgi:hypothetical protein
MPDHDDAEGFDGEIRVAVDGAPPLTAPAVLAARFDPLAGHVVWSGRVSAALPVRTPLVLTTPFGSA